MFLELFLAYLFKYPYLNKHSCIIIDYNLNLNNMYFLINICSFNHSFISSSFYPSFLHSFLLTLCILYHLFWRESICDKNRYLLYQYFQLQFQFSNQQFSLFLLDKFYRFFLVFPPIFSHLYLKRIHCQYKITFHFWKQYFQV